MTFKYKIKTKNKQKKEEKQKNGVLKRYILNKENKDKVL